MRASLNNRLEKAGAFGLRKPDEEKLVNLGTTREY